VSLHLVFDAFGQAAGDSGADIAVSQGSWFFALGWAADPAAGHAPRSIRATIDETRDIPIRIMRREDVANHFSSPELVNCGFDAGFSTAGLPAGAHTFTLTIDAGDNNPQVTRRSFAVGAQVAARGPRILIAGAPKSGSTFAWRFLNEYLGTTSPPLEGLLPPWEPNLDQWVRERLRGGSYVFGMHMKAYEANLAAIREEGLTTIVTWRNIADTLVSLDDHLHQEGGTNPVFYTDNTKFLAMPQQDRYQFLVRHYAPWCVSFYLGWKHANVPIFHYEKLASDPVAYCSEIVSTLTGTADVDRITAMVAKPLSGSRLNVGRAGRSAALFSDETKRLLEDLLEHHFEPLDDLLAELPWRSG